MICAPDWHLHLVGGGSGEERAKSLELVGRLGSQAMVHSAISQYRLAEIMHGSHFLVLPSFYEGLPMAVMEALTSGCRIVATNLRELRKL